MKTLNYSKVGRAIALLGALTLTACVNAGNGTDHQKATPTARTQQPLTGACSSYTWANTCGAAGVNVGDVVKVRAFGALGNDSVVDTVSLQKTVCCAAIMKESGSSGDAGTERAVVDFQSGAYVVDNTIEIMDGVALL